MNKVDEDGFESHILRLWSVLLVEGVQQLCAGGVPHTSCDLSVTFSFFHFVSKLRQAIDKTHLCFCLASDSQPSSAAQKINDTKFPMTAIA